MARLSTAVVRDLDADVTTVLAHGVLDMQTAAAMREVLQKVIAECPGALVVDVSDCAAAHPAALTVFPSVTRHHTWQPAVPVTLAGADAGFLAHGGRAALGSVPAYDSTESAAAAAAEIRRGQQMVVLALPAEPAAAGHARAMIGEACRRWGLPQLAIPAALVVSELVTNAVVHGHGQVRMDGSLRGRFVHIRVHDRSTLEPVLGPPLTEGGPLRDHGRGLRLIERHCSAWGFLPRADGSGKVVWATLHA